LGDANLRYCDLMIDSSSPQPAMSLPSPSLAKLFSQVLAGNKPIDDLVEAIQALPVEQRFSSDSVSSGLDTSEMPMPEPKLDSIGREEKQIHVTPGATVDLGRKSRCGFGEVIYGEGKDAELIARIIDSQLDCGQNSLVTRLCCEDAELLLGRFPKAFYNSSARTLRVSTSDCKKVSYLDATQAADQIHAAVVTAGSTDRDVAEEVSETLEWMGVPQTRFEDIGVAGPQRLIGALPTLKKASVVVVAAGMEGALPAVVGGYLSVPIFAIPTSVGYGANFGGLSALLSMLNTCASSVAVVNIDSGFKGGYLAGLVANQLIQMEKEFMESIQDSN